MSRLDLCIGSAVAFLILMAFLMTGDYQCAILFVFFLRYMLLYDEICRYNEGKRLLELSEKAKMSNVSAMCDAVDFIK